MKVPGMVKFRNMFQKRLTNSDLGITLEKFQRIEKESVSVRENESDVERVRDRVRKQIQRHVNNAHLTVFVNVYISTRSFFSARRRRIKYLTVLAVVPVPR